MTPEAEPAAVSRSSLAGLSGTVASLIVLGVSACTAPAARNAPAVPGGLAPVSRADSEWLERTSFGLDSRILGDYPRPGREHYVEEQLHPAEDPLPAEVAPPSAAPPDSGQVLSKLRQQRQAINALPDGPERDAARKA